MWSGPKGDVIFSFGVYLRSGFCQQTVVSTQSHDLSSRHQKPGGAGRRPGKTQKSCLLNFSCPHLCRHDNCNATAGVWSSSCDAGSAMRVIQEQHQQIQLNLNEMFPPSGTPRVGAVQDAILKRSGEFPPPARLSLARVKPNA